MSASSHSAEPAAVALAKLAPPTSVSLVTLFGYGLSDWILFLTAAYTLVLLIHKILVTVKEFLPKPTVAAEAKQQSDSYRAPRLGKPGDD